MSELREKSEPKRHSKQRAAMRARAKTQNERHWILLKVMKRDGLSQNMDASGVALTRGPERTVHKPANIRPVFSVILSKSVRQTTRACCSTLSFVPFTSCSSTPKVFATRCRLQFSRPQLLCLLILGHLPQMMARNSILMVTSTWRQLAGRQSAQEKTLSLLERL